MFATQPVCLRNFSQARSFGAVPGPSGEEGGQGPGPLRYAGLGVQLAVSIVAGTFGGRWVDHRVGTDGVFTMLGALLGFGGTLYSLIRQLSRAEKDQR